MTISSAKKYFELYIVAVYRDGQFIGYHMGRAGMTSTKIQSAKIYSRYRNAVLGANYARYNTRLETEVIPIDCTMAFDPLSTNKSLERAS